MLTPEQIMGVCSRHAAIIGMSGSGKTFTEKGFVEWLLEMHRHTVIIDPLGAWWGLRSTAEGDREGFPILIFGGDHADVPISVWDGPVVAEIVLRDTVSCILDLSGFRTGEDQRMFMEGFIGGLRGKKSGALNLIVDEADEFAPETVADKVGNRLKQDMVWIAKRGRLSGFIMHIITQRPADVAKAVLTQCQTMVVHQLIAPHDQKPVLDWFKGNGDATALAAVKESLASLETGERWVYSPKAKILDRDKSEAIATFDSSRTPEPGETLAEAKTLAQMDVAGIKQLLAKPVTEVDDDGDPTGALALAHDRIADLESTVSRTQAQLDSARATMDQIVDLILKGKSVTPVILDEADNFAGWKTPEKVLTESMPIVDHAPSPAPNRASSPKPVDGSGMNPTAQAFANMLADIAPATVTWAQLCSMTGRKPAGGNFNTARRQLRESGLMIESGDRLGAAVANPVGLTRAGAIDLWKRALAAMRKPRAVQMLDLLAGAKNAMTRDEIGEAIGIVARGGNWNDNFSALRNNGLLAEEGTAYSLADPLPGQR